jgi:hypothetical protein
MNDCLYSFKYEYEYLANYDFDELIFPRRQLNTQESIKCFSNDSDRDLSLYSYADNLFQYFGRYTTASLKFEQDMYSEIKSNILKFIGDILISHEKRIIRLNMTENYYVDYEIKKTHFHLNYINELKNLFKTFSKCFLEPRKSLFNDSSFIKWRKPFAFLMDIRDGKSIFNTEYTIAINQHFSFSNLFATKTQKIPIEMGYSSHIRDHIEGFFNKQKSPITYFILDMEYYKFITDLGFTLNK